MTAHQNSAGAEGSPNALSRVVWREGMHLAQQHFQAQERYFEESSRFAFRTLHADAYGLLACELDADALANGTVSVVHARGIMPDGLPFDFSDDEAPEPLAIGDLFSPVKESQKVLLAIPAYRAGAANAAQESVPSDGTRRFSPSTRSVPDEMTGADEKPVTVARKNFRLVLEDAREGDGEKGTAEALVTLPLARVRRDGTGTFVYDLDFIPPCLQVRASRRLREVLARMVDTLDAKAAGMARDRVRSDGAAGEYQSREIANFWLSHTIHAALAPLRHHLQTGAAHPEAVYRELARLAGGLCTFSMDAHPRELPAYDHEDLHGCFDGLERHIRRNLEITLPTGAARIGLTPTEEPFFRGEVTDRRCLASSDWFLEVRSPASGSEVISAVPRLVKVCSAKHIERLVQSAHSGMALEHVPSPPSELSPRIGAQYFRIGTDGPCWVSIQDTAEVGVYAPEALSEAEVEIVVALEE